MLIELLTKELTMLALPALVGSGFARALRGRLSPASQLALAPVFGFAAAIALLTTLNFFVPMRHALWFALLPAAIASIVWAVRAGGPPTRRWLSYGRDLAQVAVVLVGVLVILNAPLERRDSPGPIAWGSTTRPATRTASRASRNTPPPTRSGGASKKRRWAVLTPTPGDRPGI